MAFDSIQALKNAYAQFLRDRGQVVALDAPIGNQGTTVDILTDYDIIQCCLELTEQSAIEIRSKLDFCGRFCPGWRKVAVVAQVINYKAAEKLAQTDITVISFSSSGQPNTSQSSVSPKARPSSFVRRPSRSEASFPYNLADFSSFEGGEDAMIGLVAILAVMAIGLVGLLVAK